MKTELILASLIAGNVITGAADFVAHEWGTFTSVHAADGNQIEWIPGTAVDLPKFVYNRMQPGPDRPTPDLGDLVGKSTLLSLVRMETPVIYFYSDKERTVDVDVQFPQGIVTEWYPQTALTTNRHTRWEKVAIIPHLTDASVLPNDGSKTHYYAARETDAFERGRRRFAIEVARIGRVVTELDGVRDLDRHLDERMRPWRGRRPRDAREDDADRERNAEDHHPEREERLSRFVLARRSSVHEPLAQAIVFALELLDLRLVIGFELFDARVGGFELAAKRIAHGSS